MAETTAYPDVEEAAHAEDMGITQEEREEAEARAAPPALVIYESIYIAAIDELERPAAGLFWSGLAAGLSICFSMVGEGLMRAALPDAGWTSLVAESGYTVGFLVVILGRQQLFTENTLTPIIPLLRERNLATLLRVLRLWGIVLFANILGTFLFALLIANVEFFDDPTQAAFRSLGHHFLSMDWRHTLLGGIFAGWLLALMVWMLPYAESARIAVILIVTYVIGLGGFSHSISGSTETFYTIMTTDAAWVDYFGFFLPALLGNIIGGVTLVAAVNHAQVVAGARNK